MSGSNDGSLSRDIAVASCSLAELFQGGPIAGAGQDGASRCIEGRLTLPVYQRPYQWGGREVERLLDDLQSYFGKAPDERPPHAFYLGSVVLHQTREPPRLNIIDGQQRLTTLALLAHCQQPGSAPGLQYSSPLSQRRIIDNHAKLRGRTLLAPVDFAQINVSLVVTQSLDDAYRFFHTQNTGSVPLGGIDVVKAHHLRATDASVRDRYARLWEGLPELGPLTDSLLKARYWQGIDFRELPSRRQPKQRKRVEVEELAERTLNRPQDQAYQQVLLSRQGQGWTMTAGGAGYAMRQPLNAGVNAIQYLRHFADLRQRLLVKRPEPGLEAFYTLYGELIDPAEGCAYIKPVYDTALLLYVSQFGTEHLIEAALWLFRAVFALRVENARAVKEVSVARFVEKHALLDRIALSFNHEQVIERLCTLSYTCNPENTGEDRVKGRFIRRVEKVFKVEIDRDAFADKYDPALIAGIQRRLEAQALGEGVAHV